MKSSARRSRMALVQLLLFTAVTESNSFVFPLSTQSPARSAQNRFSTSLLSKTTLLQSEDVEPTTISTASTRKRLGKSSFLYKQHQQISTNREKASTPQELCSLAQKNNNKTKGSGQYKKAWIRWLSLAIESIREDLGENLLSTADDTIRDEFEKLFFDLGVAADVGTMPSFESEAARKGYALEFFCRGRALAEFLLETPLATAEENDDDESNTLYPRFWTRSLRSSECPILASVCKADMAQSKELATYEIVSLGSGPGFDFIGVALAAAFSIYTTRSSSQPDLCSNFNDLSHKIHVTAMDYEEGWGDLVASMDQSTKNILTPSNDNFFPVSNDPSVLSCDWGGTCDITKSILHDPSNANCKNLLLGSNDTPKKDTPKLWICQYCVAENAKALRESNFVFWKELVQEMPAGTLLLITEVVPRVWPELVRMFHREGLLPFVNIGFRQGSTKQFLLEKRANRHPESVGEDGDHPFASLDSRTREQLEHFEELASYHERKVDSGWMRQERKENGGSIYHEELLRSKRSANDQN